MDAQTIYDSDEPRTYCEVSTEDDRIHLYVEDDDGSVTQNLTPAQALALIAALSKAVSELI